MIVVRLKTSNKEKMDLLLNNMISILAKNIVENENTSLGGKIKYGDFTIIVKGNPKGNT